MKKLLSSLAAGVVALSMAGAAVAADDSVMTTSCRSENSCAGSSKFVRAMRRAVTNQHRLQQKAKMPSDDKKPTARRFNSYNLRVQKRARQQSVRTMHEERRIKEMEQQRLKELKDMKKMESSSSSAMSSSSSSAESSSSSSSSTSSSASSVQ